jgi:D-2-hydroxyglutarate dehydrogenase
MVNVVLLALDSFPSVVRLLAAARRQLGEILSAFEFLDGEAMRLVCMHLPGVANPFIGGGASSGGDAPASHPFYVLIETHSSSDSDGHDSAKLQAFLEVRL